MKLSKTIAAFSAALISSCQPAPVQAKVLPQAPRAKVPHCAIAVFNDSVRVWVNPQTCQVRVICNYPEKMMTIREYVTTADISDEMKNRTRMAYPGAGTSQLVRDYDFKGEIYNQLASFHYNVTERYLAPSLGQNLVDVVAPFDVSNRYMSADAQPLLEAQDTYQLAKPAFQVRAGSKGVPTALGTISTIRDLEPTTPTLIKTAPTLLCSKYRYTY